MMNNAQMAKMQKKVQVNFVNEKMVPELKEKLKGFLHMDAWEDHKAMSSIQKLKRDTIIEIKKHKLRSKARVGLQEVITFSDRTIALGLEWGQEHFNVPASWKS